MSHHYSVPVRCPLLPVCPDSVSRQVAQKPLSVALPFPVPVAPFVVLMFLAAGPLFMLPAALSVELSFLVQKSLEDWFLVLESAVAPFQESEAPV